MSELLPCPFCGEAAEIERQGDHRQSTIYACTMCGCRLETGEEWDHGRQWNARTPAVERVWSAADLMRVSESLRTLIGIGSPYDLGAILEAADALADASQAALASMSAHQPVEQDDAGPVIGGSVNRALMVVEQWGEIVHAAWHVLEDQEQSQQDPKLLQAMTDYDNDYEIHDLYREDKRFITQLIERASVSAPKSVERGGLLDELAAIAPRGTCKQCLRFDCICAASVSAPPGWRDEPQPKVSRDTECKGPHSWRTVVTREETYTQCKWCLKIRNRHVWPKEKTSDAGSL